METYNYIGVFLTLDCPRGCSYCLNQSVESVRPRRTVEAKTWIAGLNELAERLGTGVLLTFNGGEPLAHPDFFEIVNGLDKRIKVDMLTTLPYDVQDFIEHLDPRRFERDLPYAAIRLTFHPETMDLEETVAKVKQVQRAGFDVCISIVDHPHHRATTRAIQEQINQAGLDCFFKPFLGYLGKVLYGQYKYMGACSKQFRKTVKCSTSNLLIDPLGDIYRCHGDLFRQNPAGVLDNIFSAEVDLSTRYTTCHNFGFCHPCDVQIKFDRFGRWGYTVVDIRGENIALDGHASNDWVWGASVPTERSLKAPRSEES